MKFRKAGAVLIAMAFLFTLVCPHAAFASAKRRVAVLPFEYGAVTSTVGTVDVGKGITSLLITKLVNDGTYSVIERQMLDNILKEQNFSVSDRADQSTALKIGKLLSVDAMVVGTVTHFGFENHSMNIGAAASAVSQYIPYVGGFGFGGLKVKKGKVKVAIDARLIDTNTGEILAAVHGDGISQRSGASLWGGGGSGWSGGSGDLGFGSSGFASTIAGEATMQAVNQIGSEIIGIAAKIPDNQSLIAKNVSGKIADVTGNTVIVNVGKKNGLAAGNKLQVERAYKTVRDPDTGQVLKQLFKTIAMVDINSVDDNSGTGTIVRGEGVKVGDVVKAVSKEVTGTVLSSAGTAPTGAATPTSVTSQGETAATTTSTTVAADERASSGAQ